MHTFEHQNSAQTLAAGLAEYQETNPALVRGRGPSLQAQAFFRCHDAVHVVFGCGNTLDDEVVVKIASLLGTTAGLRVLRGHALRESLEIYRALRVMDVLVAVLESVVIVPRTVVRCLRQSRRWPWDDFDRYLNVPLRDIRLEFGIRVAHRGSKHAGG